MLTIVLGVTMFTGIVLALVAVILAARSRLVSTGTVDILVNGEKTLNAPVGAKLLNALADARLFVASACGGGGTCLCLRRQCLPCCAHVSMSMCMTCCDDGRTTTHDDDTRTRTRHRELREIPRREVVKLSSCPPSSARTTWPRSLLLSSYQTWSLLRR